MILPWYLIGELFCVITDTDDCAGVTCSDQGTCVDGIDSYTCDCDAGYTDSECSTSEFIYLQLLDVALVTKTHNMF